MSRILLTRPRPDSEALATTLTARGHAVILAPLLELALVPHAPVDPDGVQALLFTSANGVRFFDTRTTGAQADGRDWHAVPVFAVGDATAAAARAAGFRHVTSAGGDAEALAERVIASCDPAAGRLVQPAGTVTAGALSERLAAAGFHLDRRVVYEARPVAALPPEARQGLYDATIDAALFFSPRTARIFVRLVQREGMAERCARVAALCLSAAVAEAARTIPWGSLLVAARPEQTALLDLLDVP